jgi:hypothetical protein
MQGSLRGALKHARIDQRYQSGISSLSVSALYPRRIVRTVSDHCHREDCDVALMHGAVGAGEFAVHCVPQATPMTTMCSVRGLPIERSSDALQLPQPRYAFASEARPPIDVLPSCDNGNHEAARPRGFFRSPTARCASSCASCRSKSKEWRILVEGSSARYANSGKSDHSINSYLIVKFARTAISSLRCCTRRNVLIDRGSGVEEALRMSFFHQFSVFASSRGEGLHPKLRALLGRTAAPPFSEVSARPANDGRHL